MVDRLAGSCVNLARVMLILDLWSRGEYRRNINILRTLDRRSTRDFHKDLVDGLRPWMYWLELPLALSNAGLNYALKPINLPDIAAGATGWILVFATPFVLLGCTSCLWCARLLRIPVERRFDIGSFNRALLAVSVASYAMAAALGAVGSVVLPDVFLVWRR